MIMSDDEYPEYSESAELCELGRWIVEGTVRDSLQWLFREIQKTDLGPTFALLKGTIKTEDAVIACVGGFRLLMARGCG